MLSQVARGRARLRVIRSLFQHLLPPLLRHALLPLQVHRVYLPLYLLLLLSGLLPAQAGLGLSPAPALEPLLSARVGQRDGGPAHDGDGVAGAAALVAELLLGGDLFEGGYFVRVDEVGGDEGEGQDGLLGDLGRSPLALDHLWKGLVKGEDIVRSKVRFRL